MILARDSMSAEFFRNRAFRIIPRDLLYSRDRPSTVPEGVDVRDSPLHEAFDEEPLSLSVGFVGEFETSSSTCSCFPGLSFATNASFVFDFNWDVVDSELPLHRAPARDLCDTSSFSSVLVFLDAFRSFT